MLDLKLIREKPELVREALAKRNDTAPIDEILALDGKRRKLLVEVENLRARRKEGSNQIRKYLVEDIDSLRATGHRKETIESQLELLKKEMGGIGERIKALEDEIAGTIEPQLYDLSLRVPNIPHPSVPVGKDSADNKLVRVGLEARSPAFPPKPHWEIGEALGIIDFARGVKISGSRFYILRDLGARLQRALINFMLDVHISEHGYREVYPPYMVKKECMVGSGNLPKFADNLYHDEQDDFWFVPTAEVPLTNLHRDEILEPDTLPLYYVAYTACFRREKMAAGKDTRGIKRGHQFDKVEMYKFVAPETSDDELEKMVGDAEDICRRLGLPHRVIQLCTGDLGFASMKSYDIEVWAPGSAEWLEVSSCSNCGDFQARRANIRYRPAPGAKVLFPHTLNGSGLALPRMVISVLENYQQADGSVVVPEVLRPFMKAEVIK